jgi:hypothetical protein
LLFIWKIGKTGNASQTNLGKFCAKKGNFGIKFKGHWDWRLGARVLVSLRNKLREEGGGRRD